jgi:transcriptional regulator NrdR family protein
VIECPNCGETQCPSQTGPTWVTDGAVERRRKCKKCRQGFLTIEVVVPEPEQRFGYIRRTAERLLEAAK